MPLLSLLEKTLRYGPWFAIALLGLMVGLLALLIVYEMVKRGGRHP
jgi:hypothetical protein